MSYFAGTFVKEHQHVCMYNGITYELDFLNL